MYSGASEWGLLGRINPSDGSSSVTAPSKPLQPLLFARAISDSAALGSVVPAAIEAWIAETALVELLPPRPAAWLRGM